jgi:hypothetical protein
MNLNVDENKAPALVVGIETIKRGDWYSMLLSRNFQVRGNTKGSLQKQA